MTTTPHTKDADTAANKTQATRYKINWDNGGEACGTFPEEYATEAEAEAVATAWMNERNLEDLHLTPRQVNNRGGAGCYIAEVIEVEVEDADEEELLRREPWEL